MNESESQPRHNGILGAGQAETSQANPSSRSGKVRRTREQFGLTRRDVSVWALSIVLSLLYIMAGVPKLGTIEFMDARFTEIWGYPEWLEYLVGGIEFVGAVFLLIPSTAFYAAISLGGIMVGAAYTHIAVGEWGLLVVPLVCLGLLMFVAYERRPDYLREE